MTRPNRKLKASRAAQAASTGATADRRVESGLFRDYRKQNHEHRATNEPKSPPAPHTEAMSAIGNF
jgi:hypothetical protein